MKTSFEFRQIDHIDLQNYDISIFLEYVCVNRLDKHLKFFFVIYKFHEILSFNCLRLFFVFIRQCYSYFFDRFFLCHELLIIIIDAIDQLILCFCIEFFFLETHVFVERNDVVDQIFNRVVDENCYDIV